MYVCFSFGRNGGTEWAKETRRVLLRTTRLVLFDFLFVQYLIDKKCRGINLRKKCWILGFFGFYSVSSVGPKICRYEPFLHNGSGRWI